MSGKHYGWHKRWTLDAATGTARHDSGLVVHLPSTGAPPWAENAAAVEAALAATHGPHNAPTMVRRLLREAAGLRRPAPPS